MRLSRRSRFCFSATYLVRIAMTDVVYLNGRNPIPYYPLPLIKGKGNMFF